MGRRQDDLVHMELCKGFPQGLCQNENIGKPCSLQLLHSQRTGLEQLVGNTHHFIPMGSAQLPVLSWSVSMPLDLLQGVQGRLAQKPLAHLWSLLLVADQQDLCQAALVTHTPSPRAAPCRGRNCPPADLPNRERAKLDAAQTSLVACQGRLRSCLKASLCRHNKGQLSPFSHSPAMELSSV